WLLPGFRSFGLLAPLQLVQCLAEGNQTEAALSVARALLQVFERNGDIDSLFDHYLYEHHLPRITEILTRACGENAIKLFCDLLQQAAIVSGKAGDQTGLDNSHF